MAGTFTRTVVVVEPSDQVTLGGTYIRAVECRCGALVRDGRQADHERIVRHEDQGQKGQPE